MLINITNLLNDLGDGNVEVELLANGGSVRASEGLSQKYFETAPRLIF